MLQGLELEFLRFDCKLLHYDPSNSFAVFYEKIRLIFFYLLLQVLNRLTYASTLSHLRRLNSPIGREGKISWLSKYDPAFNLPFPIFALLA